MSLLVKHRQQPLCGYCRDVLAANVYICENCSAGYHQDCSEELRVCGTLGCSRPFPSNSLKGMGRNDEVASKLEKQVTNAKMQPRSKKQLGVTTAVTSFLIFCYTFVYFLVL